MYLSGILVTLLGVYMNDGDKVLEKGFFFGYTSWVCFVVCTCDKREGVSWCEGLLHVVADLLLSGALVLASVGGLYTSVVVKYTDNIMKGFSAAAAIVLSTVASVILFGLQISTLLGYVAQSSMHSSEGLNFALLIQRCHSRLEPSWCACPSTCTGFQSRTRPS